ncbi:hypothetical protein ARMGADRAFT_1084075 [Armillaria gallica]|uniref:lytic cellulose monooxygenase (C4-dehydrogenating) n=1 Tax=Armillaria gallica TaxID=47427 RepID=A0A2H3D106_ARMGA|nr:hypothetical protein ARMGADRAFT_1084075 [Armillaria gallica]
MTYLTNCGDQSCAEYDPKGAEWFKIEEAGRTADGTWAQAALLPLDVSADAIYNTIKLETSPPTMCSTQAAFASEEEASRFIFFEFDSEWNGTAVTGLAKLDYSPLFTRCVEPYLTQLKVGGSGTGTPPSSDLVQLPSACSDTDPGILVDVYSNTKASYTFPSPVVVDLVGSDSSPSAPAPASSAAPASASSAASTIASTPSATSTRKHSPSAIPASTSTSESESQGSCKLTLPTDALTKRETRPRHVSRIMRGLDFSFLQVLMR